MGATETASPSCPLVHSGHGRLSSLSGTVAVGAAQAVTKTEIAIAIVSAILICGSLTFSFTS